MEKKFFTVAEFAKEFECSVSTVRNMIKRGDIKAVQVHRTIRIPVTELDRIMQGITATSETSVNDIPATSTDAPPQPTESTTAGDKATLETDAQQPEPTTEKPSSVPEWDGISGKNEP